jgi:FkbM family methyltransferase
MIIQKVFQFRGHSFEVLCQDDPNHPSNWSFVDESIVRDRWWDIQPGQTVIDCGTAYGSYALTALACGASYVFGWSPQGHPGDSMREIDYLRRSLALNGWSDRMTVWSKSGCYDRTGWYETSTTKFTVERPDPLPEWTIYVEPIDSIMDFYTGKVDHLKLDVEGAEVHVLRGAKKLIHRTLPKILVEHHNFLVPDVERQVVDLLVGEWGYSHVGTVPHGSVSHGLYLPPARDPDDRIVQIGDLAKK